MPMLEAILTVQIGEDDPIVCEFHHQDRAMLCALLGKVKANHLRNAERAKVGFRLISQVIRVEQPRKK